MLRSPPRTPACPAVPAIRSRVTVVLVLVACVLAAGCDKGVSFLRTNQPPTIELTSGPIDTLSSPQHWIVDIAWTAHDPDGSIDHFEYAIDPPTLKQARFALVDTVWTSTTENRATVRFRATVPDTLAPGGTARSFHTFVLRAIDDRGATSPLIIRSFYATTVAPDIRITRPIPSALLRIQVPVPFRVQWESDDPDGAGSRQPAFHRWRLIDLDRWENQIYLADPDSLIEQGLATDWDGWNRVGGDTTFLDIHGPEPGSSAALAVLAVDEAGATTPYLNFNQNFLQFTTTAPNATGPRIRVYSPYVDFTYDSGGWALDLSREIPVEMASRPAVFYWTGIPLPGRVLESSRWMVDGIVTDDTPRSSPDDITHWSDWGSPEGAAELPALAIGEHRLYIELRDDFGDRSLAIVRLTVVETTLERELLVVDDTRLEVDRFPSPGVLGTYTRPWPSATELDTFLFARGGWPWRATKNPTTGVLSTPGLFAGYPHDTLGTRQGLEDPTRAVSLTRLGSYRHVVLIVDGTSAAYQEPWNPTGLYSSWLRAISAPGHANVLGAYVELGGQVWLAGGGAAAASLLPWDHGANNNGGVVIASEIGELGPGRSIYDHAHVRSAMNFASTPHDPSRAPAAVGGWSGHGPTGTLAAPDYQKLPPAMRLRTPATDPMPPTRLASQANLYYLTNTAKEFVLDPNAITEDMDPDPDVVRTESTLDTLYEAPDPLAAGAARPVMLYYHGRDNAPFVFTGFDLWSWTRADCQGLVDFVLGDIWGLAKSGVASKPARMAKSAASRSAAVTPTRNVRR